MANSQIQTFKKQAERLAQYLESLSRKVTRVESLEALSRATFDRPWNTVKQMLDEPESKNTRVPGRADPATGEPLVLGVGKEPLSEKQLRSITEEGKHYVDAVVCVSLWDIAHNDIDWLNDHVSELITGSIVGLEDISYSRFSPESPAEHAVDETTLFLRVVACWCTETTD